VFEFSIAARLADLVVSLPRYQFARDTHSDAVHFKAGQNCGEAQIGLALLSFQVYTMFDKSETRNISL
jgi:hypothetical protein